MKQQITENEENLFFGKTIAHVSVVTLKLFLYSKTCVKRPLSKRRTKYWFLRLIIA